MVWDERFFALPLQEVEQIHNQYDLFHIDYENGEMFISRNTEKPYSRPMFMVEKSFGNVAYVTFIVFSLRFSDGNVQFVDWPISLFESYDEAKKNIIEEYHVVKNNCTYEGYYTIKVDGKERGSIDFDQIISDVVIKLELISWKIITLNVV